MAGDRPCDMSDLPFLSINLEITLCDDKFESPEKSDASESVSCGCLGTDTVLKTKLFG